MRNVKVTLAIGIALIAVIGAVTLTRSPPRVLAANGPHASAPLISTTNDLSVCQTGETLPAGTTALRLSMWAFLGWKLNVKAYLGRQVIAEGSRGPEWTSTEVTVPVKPLSETASNVTLCFTTGPNSEPELILGDTAPEGQAAALLEPGVPAYRAHSEGRLPGRFGVEYIASGSGSWWSRIGSVASAMGLGRSFSGTWIVWLTALLMLAVAALALRLTLREIP
jgi:hypothetical protein